MIIAKVVPLRRLPAHLDWFDYEVPESMQADLHVGVLVQIPFQKTSTQGIVFQITEKSGSVIEVSKLKAIEKIIDPTPLLGEKQGRFLAWFSDYYGISKASCIKMMIPPSPKRERATKKSQSTQTPTPTFQQIQVQKMPHGNNPLLYHSTDLDERYTQYTILAGEHIKNGEQILILCPTVAEAKKLAETLHVSTNTAPALLHGELALVEHFNTYRSVAKGEISIIIGTRTALFCNFNNLKTIILDQAERQEYKQSDQNPRYDTRTVAHRASEFNQCRLILTSAAPRLEDWHLMENNSLTLVKTNTPPPEVNVINLKDEFSGGNYSFISDELRNELDGVVSKNQSALLFINRKGASVVTCKECDYLFICPTCNTTSRYHAKTNELVCSVCKTQRPLPDQCPECNGIEYKFPGLGIEKIAKTIQKLYPSTNVIIIEQTKDKKIAPPKNWDNTIILATSYALINYPEIFSHTSLTATIAADPTIAMYDFRSQEYQWQTLAHLITLTTINPQKIILQSFNPLTPFITSIATMDYPVFAANELKDRKTFHLPPFTTYLDLIYRPTDPRNTEKQALETAATFLKRHLLDLDKLPNFPKISINTIKKDIKKTKLRIEIKRGYDSVNEIPEQLTELIKMLPSGWMRDIDPID